MLRVGLTGGIGAGKSTVARRLASLGARVIDADVLAREVVEPGTAGLAAVVDEFGDGVLAADGSLDRAALAARAFADEGSRRRLEAVLHPRIASRTAELISSAPADAIVVHDVPLLVEKRMGPGYHLVLVVDAPASVRVDRLVRLRGMGQQDAQRRVRAQASDEQRRAAADVIIDNTGERAVVDAFVDHLWIQRLVPFEQNVRQGRPAVVQHVAPAVVPADPAWRGDGARLVARLERALGAAAQCVQHVGPTAAAGEPAPDVIDIDVEVADDPSACVQALSAAGFAPVPADWPAAEGESLFGTCDPGRPSLVHVRTATAST